MVPLTENYQTDARKNDNLHVPKNILGLSDKSNVRSLKFCLCRNPLVFIYSNRARGNTDLRKEKKKEKEKLKRFLFISK